MKEEKLLVYEEYNVSLLKVKDDKESFNNRFRLLSNMQSSKAGALFIYPGSKKKMYEKLNIILDELYMEKIYKTNTGYSIFVDAFVGAANSTFVMMELLKLMGIKKYILNDLDSIVLYAHKHCKENKDQLIEEFSEIIRTKFIIPYSTFVMDKKLFEKITRNLIDEFEELQSKKKYTIRTSILFIILRDLEFSGLLKYFKEEDGGGHKFSGKLYDPKKYFNFIFRQIPKIERISRIYNDLDVEFTNLDCFELFKDKRIAGNPDVLINLDPPYLEESEEIIDEETLKNKTSKELKECIQNYNNEFPHIDLLKLLPNMNYIYNNNKNPVITYYGDLALSNVCPFDRNHSIGSKKGFKNKKIKEHILYKNSLLK